MDAQAESSSRARSTKHEAEDGLMGSPNPRTVKTRRRCICLSVTAVILALGLLFLILGLTVFKAKRPVTTVNSVALDDLDFSLDIARFRVLLNVTLDVDMSIYNPNRVGFKYSNGTASLRYRGTDVGVIPVPAGKIGSRDTRSMNLTLTLMADRLLSNSALYSDAISGTLPFQAYVRIPGKARIIFSIHVVTYTTCDVEVDLGNRTISKQDCNYKAKL
ncbi:hypothetical protein CDL12_21784 [Handroanthus impetiginosus]|uniref:Late embryogenesis abundant protein LEA-2 subgroup domain-containing protein n=1 Tax=Handroanthus impetiginosus TaxID=429701 RepID=A0A2G9G6V7_9LAMI|nr:hypothetical protein CDL12_26461 [Handroanthus impetiginosus]PIN05676.1 hypothetical protein CDL12_21784 [Handroanthus impetiginosus]